MVQLGRVSLMATMGAVMIALVVFIHLPLADVLWCHWWKRWGADGICRIGVPWFFFASGVFFARHVGEGKGWYGREVRKRVGNLLVPYFALNAIWLPFMIASNWIGTKCFGQPMVVDASWPCVIRGLGLSPFAWPIVVPTWFLRSLFVVVVIMGLIASGLRIKATDWIRKTGVAIAFWGAYVVQRHWFSFPAADAFFQYAICLQGLALFATGILFSPFLYPRNPCPGDVALRSFTWSVLVLHAPILSVLTMPLKALDLLTPTCSMPIGYVSLWAAALALSFALGRLLHISRLRISL